MLRAACRCAAGRAARGSVPICADGRSLVRVMRSSAYIRYSRERSFGRVLEAPECGDCRWPSRRDDRRTTSAKSALNSTMSSGGWDAGKRFDFQVEVSLLLGAEYHFEFSCCLLGSHWISREQQLTGWSDSRRWNPSPSPVLGMLKVNFTVEALARFSAPELLLLGPARIEVPPMMGLRFRIGEDGEEIGVDRQVRW